MKIAAEKNTCLPLAKHLLGILMGMNGRAGTGERGVDWPAGRRSARGAAVYRQHKLLQAVCVLSTS